MGLLDLFNKKTSLEASGLLNLKTDRHSHILPGVDDGFRVLDDSLKALEYLEKQGITTVWCTPHIMEEMPNTTEDLRNRFSELCEAYKGNLELHLGAEYMMDMLFEDRLSTDDLIVGEDGFLLMETYTDNHSTNIFDVFKRVMAKGYKPLFAHPERYRYLNQEDYRILHDMGVCFQLNIPSAIGYYGEDAFRKAFMLLQKGWYSCMGFDAHRLGALKEQCDGQHLKKEIVPYLKFFG